MLNEDGEARESTLNQIESNYSNKDWVTDQMKNEIKMNFPTIEDVDNAKQNQRNASKVESKIIELLPVRKYFINKLQLNNVLLSSMMGGLHQLQTLGLAFLIIVERKKRSAPTV